LPVMVALRSKFCFPSRRNCWIAGRGSPLRGYDRSFRGLRACLRDDVPSGQNSLDLIFPAKVKHRLIGLHRSIRPVEMRMVERDLTRIVGDDAMLRLDDRCIRATEHHVNLRRQGQRVALARVLHAHGPTRGLRRSKFDPGSGHGVSAVLVKNQIVGLQVDRILHFFRCGLIRTGEARRVGHKIDLHVAFGGDVARLLVEGKIVAIDLIEARGVAAIEQDADVVQLGVAVKLEFFDVAGLDGKERALAVGFGKLKAAGRLLDVQSDFARDLFQHVGRPRTRVEIHSGHDQREQHGGRGQQAAQTVDLKWHLGSV
jgi:hypothetical protein